MALTSDSTPQCILVPMHRMSERNFWLVSSIRSTISWRWLGRVMNIDPRFWWPLPRIWKNGKCQWWRCVQSTRQWTCSAMTLPTSVWLPSVGFQTLESGKLGWLFRMARLWPTVPFHRCWVWSTSRKHLQRTTSATRYVNVALQVSYSCFSSPLAFKFSSIRTELALMEKRIQLHTQSSRFLSSLPSCSATLATGWSCHCSPSGWCSVKRSWQE